jgi:hypothetical protein
VVLTLGDVATQCRQFSIVQWERIQAAGSRASASRWRREVIAYTVSTEGLAWPARRRRRTTLIARVPCGNSQASGGVVEADDLDRARLGPAVADVAFHRPGAWAQAAGPAGGAASAGWRA